MTRVLIVDDEPEVCELLHEHLTDAGYEIATAANGREGLQIMSAFRPEIVFTDIYMPEMDGIELITRIRSRFPDTKIVATSGGGRVVPHTYLNQARSLGATVSIRKPISLRQVLDLVKKIAGERDAGEPTWRSSRC